jgi:MFS family permease
MPTGRPRRRRLEENDAMRPILLFAYAAGIGLGITFLNIPPALAELQRLYGASYTGMSVLLSALLGSHALLQIPAGMVIDRLGLKRSLLLGLLLMSAGNLLPAAAPELTLAVAGRIITGLGTGISFISVLKLIAVTAPGRRSGSLQSFFAAFFSLGNILAYILVPRLVRFGWQWVYGFPAACCLGLLFWWLSVRPPRPAPLKAAAMPVRRLFFIRAGWILGLYHGLSYGSIMALGSWMPVLISEVRRGASAAELSLGGALVMAMAGLGRLSGGYVLMRFSALQVATGSVFALAGLYLLLFAAPPPGMVLALALAVAWVSCINFGSFFHLAASAVGAEALATFFGFVNFLANLGAVLLTLSFGMVKDLTGSLYWGFGGLAVIAAAAFFGGRGALKRDCAGDSCRIAQSP